MRLLISTRVGRRVAIVWEVEPFVNTRVSFGRRIDGLMDWRSRTRKVFTIDRNVVRIMMNAYALGNEITM